MLSRSMSARTPSGSRPSTARTCVALASSCRQPLMIFARAMAFRTPSCSRSARCLVSVL
jgi:hypothetical protein